VSSLVLKVPRDDANLYTFQDTTEKSNWISAKSVLFNMCSNFVLQVVSNYFF